jgi:hypothetical protein
LEADRTKRPTFDQLKTTLLPYFQKAHDELSIQIDNNNNNNNANVNTINEDRIIQNNNTKMKRNINTIKNKITKK